MKFLIHVLIVAIAGSLLSWFFPWWTIAIVGFLVALRPGGSYGQAFFGGFLGMLIGWAGMALYISWTTGSPLPDRVAELISPALNGTLLALVTGVLGGLVTGIAGIAGHAFSPRK